LEVEPEDLAKPVTMYRPAGAEPIDIRFLQAGIAQRRHKRPCGKSIRVLWGSRFVSGAAIVLGVRGPADTNDGRRVPEATGSVFIDM
jgi:hypothetical protein